MKMSFESILSLCSFSHKEKSKQNIKTTSVIYGLFFSAHWCPKSESITSEIKNFYHAVNSTTPQFEIFFLSSDIDKKSYEKSIKTMPWYSFAYNSPEISQLENELNIYSIPDLLFYQAKERSFAIMDIRTSLIMALSHLGSGSYHQRRRFFQRR